MRFLGLALFSGVCFAAITPMAEPSVSPDRKELAFVSSGDIWTVPLQGGARRGCCCPMRPMILVRYLAPMENGWRFCPIETARRTSTYWSWRAGRYAG